ncbi:hypothetical protein D3C77_256980 [compost metagenome]
MIVGSAQPDNPYRRIGSGVRMSPVLGVLHLMYRIVESPVVGSVKLLVRQLVEQMSAGQLLDRIVQRRGTRDVGTGIAAPAAIHEINQRMA